MHNNIWPSIIFDIRTRMYHIYLLLPLLHFSLFFCQPKRFYQKGNVTLGVLQKLHIKNAEDQCGEMYTFGLGSIEAITFAIEKINNDPNLLPNVTLGFDIRDYCDSPVLAMKMATNFVKTNYLNELIEEQKDKAAELKSLKMNLTSPISAGETPQWLRRFKQQHNSFEFTSSG